MCREGVNRPVMASKSFLICTYSAGYGHHKVSQAIREALLAVDPGAEVHIADPWKLGSPRLNDLLNNVYLKMLKRGPFIYRTLYTRAENAERAGKRSLAGSIFLRLLTGRLFCFRLDSLIDSTRPSVIICVHPFAALAVSRWKAWKKAEFPPVTGVITDFTVHPFWAQAALDGYFVASHEFKLELAKRGVSRNKIWISGIPVGAEFTRSLNKLSTRMRLGLDLHHQTVLVMGGGLGLGDLHEVVECIGKSGLPVQTIVVTGRNKVLQDKLTGLIQGMEAPVKVFGFVDNIPELMSASDIIVTKPGGVTVAEALAARLPILVWRPIPGQEERNTSFVVSRQLGAHVRGTAELMEKLRQLIETGPGNHLELAALQRLAARNVACIVRDTYIT